MVILQSLEWQRDRYSVQFRADNNTNIAQRGNLWPDHIFALNSTQIKCWKKEKIPKERPKLFKTKEKNMWNFLGTLLIVFQRGFFNDKLNKKDEAFTSSRLFSQGSLYGVNYCLAVQIHNSSTILVHEMGKTIELLLMMFKCKLNCNGFCSAPFFNLLFSPSKSVSHNVHV